MPSMHNAMKRCPLLSKSIRPPSRAPTGMLLVPGRSGHPATPLPASLTLQPRTDDGDAARYPRNDAGANARERPLGRAAARGAYQYLVDVVHLGVVNQRQR